MAPYIKELFFALCQFAMALDQAQIFKSNRTFSHFWWGVIAGVLVTILWAIPPVTWYMPLLLLVERFVLFNPMLNLIRGENVWYLDEADPNASEIDKLVYKHYVPIYFICLVVFIISQLLI